MPLQICLGLGEGGILKQRGVKQGDPYNWHNAPLSQLQNRKEFWLYNPVNSDPELNLSETTVLVLYCNICTDKAYQFATEYLC